MYTSKSITKDSNEYNEVFVDQTRKVQNQEVIYEEFTVHMFFACEDLWDPTILQNQNSDGTALGTVANYRAKLVVCIF